jgi:molybdopterin/thiamine biosynthesis adenylyltransferase
LLSCQQAGILGAVAGTIGSIQATEAIKFLAGFEEGLLTDRLLTYDARAMKFHTVDVKRSPECGACGVSRPSRG